MKIAIIGSRNISNITEQDIIKNIPKNCSEIVSGGADGIDTLAENVAKILNISIKIFKPNYQKYGKSAPIKRNREIIDYADYVLAFWNFKSKGTSNVILTCIKLNKPFKIIKI
ncbi:MAG: hypothetical protein IJC83_00815 [Oscillospiraceae bacterium]|nr:hypothetical protein [Oscillospiraceae bacterium]